MSHYLKDELWGSAFCFSMIVLAGCYTPWDVRLQHSSDRAGLGRKLALAVSEATGLLDPLKWDLKCWDGATKG